MQDIVHNDKLTTAPIITLTGTEWHTAWWMSRQHLMSRMARRGWPVVYSNGPFTNWERGSLRWAKGTLLGSEEAIPCGDGCEVLLDHAPQLLTDWNRLQALRPLVFAAYANRLRRFMRRYSDATPIVFLNNPAHIELAERLSPGRIVLYVNDQWRRHQGWSETSDALLKRSVERAAMIISVAETMAKDLPGDGPERSRILPHGVDLALFEQHRDAECPEDLSAIPRPRIGYIGRVSKKVDLDLMLGVARARPDWHWVIVGAVGVGFGDDKTLRDTLGALQQQDNVHFLGVRDRELVPGYLRHMDVNAICFRTTSDGYWGGTSPTKLWEYFATGHPIISTPLETVLPWRSHVRIGATPEEWVELIDDALAKPDPALRERLADAARDNSWDHRADQLETWLREI